MTPELEQARDRVRSAATALKLATQSGRVELRDAGHVSAETWALADHLSGELEERLGELERAERHA